MEVATHGERSFAVRAKRPAKVGLRKFMRMDADARKFAVGYSLFTTRLISRRGRAKFSNRQSFSRVALR
jgi:hypothetical protein